MSILAILLFSWLSAPGYLPAGFILTPNGPVYVGTTQTKAQAAPQPRLR